MLSQQEWLGRGTPHYREGIARAWEIAGPQPQHVTSKGFERGCPTFRHPGPHWKKNCPGPHRTYTHTNDSW